MSTNREIDMERKTLKELIERLPLVEENWLCCDVISSYGLFRDAIVRIAEEVSLCPYYSEAPKYKLLSWEQSYGEKDNSHCKSCSCED